MKYKILVVLFILTILLSFQGCIGSKNKTSYNSLNITDDGLILKNGDYVIYSLQDFILLLKEESIPITEIKGSDKVFISDAGSVRFKDTSWNYMFYPKIKTAYDVVSLNDLITKQAIEAVYVKTPYETFTFRQSLGNRGEIVSIDSFYSDVIITTNQNFITEKGIKIGDSFKYASEKYSFRNEDIVKVSDCEWSVWVPNSNIIFNGSKDRITSIELGHQVACSS